MLKKILMTLYLFSPVIAQSATTTESIPNELNIEEDCPAWVCRLPSSWFLAATLNKPLNLQYSEDNPPQITIFPSSKGRFILPTLKTQWMLDSEPNLSSVFGFRWKSSSSRYDWHRGLDVPDTLGKNVYSIAAGTVFKVVREGDSQAPEGGNTVYIEHLLSSDIQFHNQTVNRFYSLQMHLDTIDNSIVEGATVAIGQKIGTLGQSGTTTFNHDHFEIRLQTHCSLTFQLSNPSSSCSFGFDPHVNPIQFLFANDNVAPELESLSLSKNKVLTATVTTAVPVADFDYIVLLLKDITGKVIYSRASSFNGREGFDASSTQTLDVPTVDGVTYTPAIFGSTTNLYRMSFEYDLSAVLNRSGIAGALLIQDVWGNSRSFSLSFD